MGSSLEPARDSLLSVNSRDLYFIHTYGLGARSKAAVLYRNTAGRRGTTDTGFIYTSASRPVYAFFRHHHEISQDLLTFPIKHFDEQNSWWDNNQWLNFLQPDASWQPATPFPFLLLPSKVLTTSQQQEPQSLRPIQAMKYMVLSQVGPVTAAAGMKEEEGGVRTQQLQSHWP